MNKKGFIETGTTIILTVIGTGVVAGLLADLKETKPPQWTKEKTVDTCILGVDCWENGGRATK